METTFARNEGTNGPLEGRSNKSSRPSLSPTKSERTLDFLVSAFRDRGAEVPIAVVSSIFDDLLERTGSGRSLSFGDVEIDVHGRASSGRGASRGTIAELLLSVLGSEVPARAWTFFARVDEAEDAEQLRDWMRDALGPPTSHDEVALLMDAVTAPLEARPSEIEVVVLSAIEPALNAPVHDTVRPTKIEARASQTELVVPLPIAEDGEELETLPPHLFEEVVRGAESSRPIKVVRHEWKRSSISMPHAPAARRSARPVLDARDGLALPGERSPWVAWLVIATITFGIAFIWLRYL